MRFTDLTRCGEHEDGTRVPLRPTVDPFQRKSSSRGSRHCGERVDTNNYWTCREWGSRGAPTNDWSLLQGTEMFRRAF